MAIHFNLTGSVLGKKKLFGLGATLGLGLMMTVPGVAQADNSACAYEGYDRACFTNYDDGTFDGASRLTVCDNEADGNGVYAIFNTTYYEYSVKVGDGNGSASGCGTLTWGHGVAQIKICEDDYGDDTCRFWPSY